MKKIFVITSMALTSVLMFAQDTENELKNFRFGLKVAPSVNWYKPEGKLLSPNGVGAGFGGGLVLEFRLAKVISIQTGAQIDMDRGKIKYNNGGLHNAGSNSVSYYYNNIDEKIEKYNSDLASNPSNYTHYQLNERFYKVTYITIPFALKMKTKEIGTLTYYGLIGMNNSFRWKASADDKLTVIQDNSFGRPSALGATESKSKIEITKDMRFYTASLNFGLGAEMNLSGTTSLTFGLNYSLGFLSATNKSSDYLERLAVNADGSDNYVLLPLQQTVKSNAVVLNIGILF